MSQVSSRASLQKNIIYYSAVEFIQKGVGLFGASVGARPRRRSRGALCLGVDANATSDEDRSFRGKAAPSVSTQSYILRRLFYQIAFVCRAGFLNDAIRKKPSVEASARAAWEAGAFLGVRVIIYAQLKSDRLEPFSATPIQQGSTCTQPVWRRVRSPRVPPSLAAAALMRLKRGRRRCDTDPWPLLCSTF